MQTSKCIYCLQEKNISEFNSEHVVSRFIGKYEDAYTLHESQVCKECNDYFCTTLENDLSFDSLEGLLRIEHSPKAIHVQRSIGRTRLTAVGNNGIVKNLPFYFTSAPTQANNIQIVVPPLVGIILDQQADEYEYFSLDSIPQCDDSMMARIAGVKTPFITFNCNGDEASKALKSKGYDISKAKYSGGLNLEDISSESVIDTTINCLVDNKVVRLAAKNLFNFLCLAYGKEKVLHPAFNNFRNFIRYNHVDKPLKFFMSEGGIKNIPGITQKNHIIGLAWSAIDKQIHLCGFVTWFNAITYTFAITPVPTKRFNAYPKLKTMTCNNEKKILSVEEYLMSLDWPGEQVTIKFLDENFRPIEM